MLSLNYQKQFLFRDGIRYDAGWSWHLECCDTYILDADMYFCSEVVAPGGWHSSLIDQNGNVVLEWLDLAPEPEDADFQE